MTLNTTLLQSRILSLALLITLGTLLSACGGSGGSSNSNKQADSSATTSLPASIPDPEPIAETPPAEVRAPLTVTLTWTAPFSRENGEPLTMGEISGYEIVTETDASQQATVTVPTADVTTHTFENLAPANYAFAIYTYDNENKRSMPSAPLTILESQFPLQ